MNLGNKTRVPIVSFSATSPSISPAQVPYFVRTTLDDSLQVKCIASIIKLYGWRDVVPIYEDTRYGAGIIPYLVDAIEEIDGRIPYRSVIELSASDYQIKQELFKLKTMSTRVFVVHMSSRFGARFFQFANELGMVDDEYVWILTDGITNMIDSMESSTLESMQGALGIRPYVPKSAKLVNFTRKWRNKYLLSNPDDFVITPNIYCLRAYDTVWALAMAAEKLNLIKIGFQKSEIGSNSTDLGILYISQLGPDFLRNIMDVKYESLAGEFLLVNGELQSSVFEIINVNGKAAREVGYREKGKISRSPSSRLVSSPGELPIIWPGEINSVPKGWVIPTSGKKLQVFIPRKNGFKEFVTVKRNPDTNQTEISGFCIDVFDAVMRNMPYSVPYEYKPDDADGEITQSYNVLVNGVAEQVLICFELYNFFLFYLFNPFALRKMQRFDVVVGDVTILFNRSKTVDFTLPFTESGWTMVVKVKRDDRSGWIFIKPWKGDLWTASFLFFVFTGFVVWIIEHRVNPDFRGPPQQHVGRSFYFTFSTMVFSHSKLINPLLICTKNLY